MNGATVALQLVPAETPEPAPAPSGETERAIGEATAFAVGVLSAGAVEHWEGKLTSKTKMLGGEAVARLFELQQAAPSGLDFAATVRAHGMRTLRAQHAAGQDRAVEFPEMLAAETIDGLLVIVGRVTAHMRAAAN